MKEKLCIYKKSFTWMSVIVRVLEGGQIDLIFNFLLQSVNANNETLLLLLLLSLSLSLARGCGWGVLLWLLLTYVYSLCALQLNIDWRHNFSKFCTYSFWHPPSSPTPRSPLHSFSSTGSTLCLFQLSHVVFPFTLMCSTPVSYTHLTLPTTTYV